MAFLQAVQRFEGKAREIMAREAPTEQARAEASNQGEPYQGPGSFERLFSKVDAEITKRFPRDGVDLTEEERAEANRITDELDRLWFLGEAQEAGFEVGTSETYQAFRETLITWYRFWTTKGKRA